MKQKQNWLLNTSVCNVEWQGEGLNITEFFVMNTPVLALTLPLIGSMVGALSPVVKLPKHEATFSLSYIANVLILTTSCFTQGKICKR
jgi:hypothetical protein